MAEGLQAGRLEVPVVADLAGFAAKLRTEVETAAEGLAAQVKVKIDDKGLRKRLEKAVKKASQGITAKIRVKVDDDRLRSELDGVRRRIADADLNLPIRPDADGDRRGGGLLGGVRSLITGAQGEADRNPVNVPVRMRMPRGRGGLRMLGIGALVSLAQPAVALIGQYALGLTALVSAAAPAVGVLGAIPGLIAAAGTAAIGTKVAFSGFGDAVAQALKAHQQLAAGEKLTEDQQAKLDQSMGKLSKSARKTVTSVVSLSSAWSKMKMSVQERFFSRVADDIKPLSKSVLPLLKSMLGDSADQMGAMAERGAKFMRSGIFRKDFKTIAGSNSRVLGSITGSIGNLGRATLDYLVASGPFVERVGRAGERATQWMRASAKAGRETGSLARFLDHAGDKAAQLGRSTGSLIKGIGGVGRAAQDSGNALLDSFEGTLKRFERWANSGVGQKVMEQFFSDAAPMFHELNMLVGDAMRGIGGAMKNGGVTDLVRQIRTEMMPALGTFFSALGQSVGPAVISVISNIATAIGDLSAAGSGLGILLMALNGLLQVFNGLMHVIPGAGTALATLLGTLLALKVITAVSGMLRGFGTQVAAAGASARMLGTTMRGTLGPGVIGPQITTWQRMQTAYRGAATEGGRLSQTMRGLGAANRVASTAMGGMMSAMGGPLGLAIAGVTIGLGLLASSQEKTARATKAHEDRVKSLSDALSASGGVIDANVRAQAAQLLQETKLADGKGKLVDVMRAADIKLGDLTSAYLGQGKSLGDLQKELQATTDAHTRGVMVGGQWVQKTDDTGLAAMRAKDALGLVRGELESGVKKQKELADAVNSSGTTGTNAYGRLSSAVTSFGDKTKSADERVDALKRALDALNGNTESFHDATARLDAQMLSIDDTMAGTIEKTDGWGKALIDADGMVDTSTRNGQTLNTQLSELRDNMLGVATRAKEAAEQGLMPMSEAMSRSKAAMEEGRAKAIEFARSLGIPKAEAQALIDQMGMVPDTVTMLVKTDGMRQVNAELIGLTTDLKTLGKGQSIEVKAPTDEAMHSLRTLGFVVTGIPGSKNVKVTAPTGEASGNLKALASDITNAPNSKTVTVQAIVAKAITELEGIKSKVAGLKGKKLTMDAPTATAQKQLTDLGFKIKNLKGKKVQITAPTGSAVSAVNSLNTSIQNLKDRNVTVTTTYVQKGHGGALKYENGGILRFANGGFNRAVGKVKAFAQGGLEKHVAQIARGGPTRIWNEPSTGGEAYIPLSPAKRSRSMAILDQVAREFGGRVLYFANGGFAGQAAGGASPRRTGTTAVSRAASTAQTASPLVGGDLNLNIGAVGTTKHALEDAMFQLRLMRLGGGG
ncbi:hypothetical protein ACK03K_34520, partial [[Kitasatospora] papulosa]|uniref:hypothetical protein n=1 Tax=[Kitasatospora] papulosa TaxID=1464011 RepID=UPI00390820C0